MSIPSPLSFLRNSRFHYCSIAIHGATYAVCAICICRFPANAASPPPLSHIPKCPLTPPVPYSPLLSPLLPPDVPLIPDIPFVPYHVSPFTTSCSDGNESSFRLQPLLLSLVDITEIQREKAERAEHGEKEEEGKRAGPGAERAGTRRRRRKGRQWSNKEGEEREALKKESFPVKITNRTNKGKRAAVYTEDGSVKVQVHKSFKPYRVSVFKRTYGQMCG